MLRVDGQCGLRLAPDCPGNANALARSRFERGASKRAPQREPGIRIVGQKFGTTMGQVRRAREALRLHRAIFLEVTQLQKHRCRLPVSGAKGGVSGDRLLVTHECRSREQPVGEPVSEGQCSDTPLRAGNRGQHGDNEGKQVAKCEPASDIPPSPACAAGPCTAMRIRALFPSRQVMLASRLIERKRDGGRISPGEWRALINAYASEHVPDYQMAALLMAIFLRGLDEDETVALTEAMLESGGTLDLAHLTGRRVDKHSTGGVGDKVSLVLAPLIAELGVVVPMMSGRSLGHTGGTLDKLEAIPGFRTDLTLREAREQVEALGCILIGQTTEIAPADRKMYALRDSTATVESIPLIAASIMSKKLAEGLTGLVLDIKRGSGSFLPGLDRGLELARMMISLGERRSCEVVALLTAMDRPLGRACGNALETEEAIHALRGEGPPDLMEVTYALGAEMLVIGGAAETEDDARRMMEISISSGRAAERFARVIEAQGGNPAVVDDPALLPQAHECELYNAPRQGFVARVEPRAVGRAVVAMGGGRTRTSDRVDHSVGFVVTAKPGDWTSAGEPLATIFARDQAGIEIGRASLAEAIVIADEAEHPLPLISHRVTIDGVGRYSDRRQRPG
jgi:pyrimidine-nucleoside phosphorylase